MALERLRRRAARPPGVFAWSFFRRLLDFPIGDSIERLRLLLRRSP